MLRPFFSLPLFLVPGEVLLFYVLKGIVFFGCERNSESADDRAERLSSSRYSIECNLRGKLPDKEICSAGALKLSSADSTRELCRN